MYADHLLLDQLSTVGPMARRKSKSMDVHEIVRHARMGRARKQFGRPVSASQPTVRKYLAWAETEGLLVGPWLEHAALE